jgi:hypothetical protein
MIISGVITCSMLLAAISPQTGLMTTFGDTMSGNLANIVVRNWGGLIALIGAMLIYGAYNEANRSLVLVVACISKFMFVFLNLIYGQAYFAKSGIALVFDSVLIVLFASYLLFHRSKKT